MNMNKIFIIEDEGKIARVLALELQYEGYETMVEGDGKKGLEIGIQEEWDLMILDVMLPSMSGLEVLRKIRGAGIHKPIILLTARDSIPDKVSGLDFGANDYMTKPFAIEELLARIRSLLRYSSQIEQKEADTVSFQDLYIDTKTRNVKRGDSEIDLTPREFDLLLYLTKNAGEVLSREKLLAEVWGYDFMGDTNIVDVYIRYLRQKIDKGFSPKLIHTKRGIGYVLKDKDEN
ncbi:response regulator transcription factor [Ammoniphilus resinae]|uniref:DNA-binding response OmpR family regulator n=1 Tax=Ammoniphilus resinae TaxID=861532 RepID=A0ABS4GRI3_9BACL|nr:response regulator transcription factor [Ammoniphilus resinae]MBP1932869.1 DNA-binding response OmpR family regulator [Ammoniphilus resinae]